MIAFAILSIILVAASLSVVLLRNPIYSALALILHMVVIAGLYAQLNAHFLATAQIVVYAGAIMVLILFVLMLLNTKGETQNAQGIFLLVVASIVGALFLYLALPLISGAFKMFDTEKMASAPQGTVPQGTVLEIGQALFTRYVTPFEIASLLIMTALAGAVMLATRRYRGLEGTPTLNPGRAEFMRAGEKR